jgi:F-type H+-transporting ATPase subunit delta
MRITKAARRYATALLELGKERNEVEAILDDMNFINNTMDDSRELVLFLGSPVIKYDEKQSALEELFGSEVEEATRLFLKLLARKQRVDILKQIAKGYIEAYNKYAGILEVKVSVARDLSDAQEKALHDKLEAITGKQIRLDIAIDEKLRGGMAVRIDDTVIDGTVKHKLQELEEQLLSTAIVE